MNRNRATSTSVKRSDGFSLLEVMFSMVVMTIGLVALLGVMGIAMASTQTSEELAISKRLANEALEGILTARETSQVQWSMIANGTCAVGTGCTTGIFLAGPQAINLPGPDGIIGTSDDAGAGAQILEQPGASGVWVGTCPPDICTSLTNYTRTIAIAPVAGDANLNSVTITVTYTNPQLRTPQNYVLSTYISQYR
ncbi:MAG: prepilin-type N-terminal cleavage/methylation domain-containing protein [Acidobacteriaceae bacterium]|nr:prepilin-type N-terminal cleavage/methylation domain-containing protein [Acidobacteriaceae bacterium]